LNLPEHRISATLFTASHKYSIALGQGAYLRKGGGSAAGTNALPMDIVEVEVIVEVE